MKMKMILGKFWSKTCRKSLIRNSLSSQPAQIPIVIITAHNLQNNLQQEELCECFVEANYVKLMFSDN